MVASPALAEGGAPGLYVCASAGRVCRLDPGTGTVGWSFDVRADSGLEPQLFSSPALAENQGAGGDRRRLFFGSGQDTFSVGVLYCLQDELRPAPGE